jgi:hypothetical protein
MIEHIYFRDPEGVLAGEKVEQIVNTLAGHVKLSVSVSYLENTTDKTKQQVSDRLLDASFKATDAIKF